MAKSSSHHGQELIHFNLTHSSMSNADQNRKDSEKEVRSQSRQFNSVQRPERGECLGSRFSKKAKKNFEENTQYYNISCHTRTEDELIRLFLWGLCVNWRRYRPHSVFQTSNNLNTFSSRKIVFYLRPIFFHQVQWEQKVPTGEHHLYYAGCARSPTQINTSVHESFSPHTSKTIAGGPALARPRILPLLSSQSGHTQPVFSPSQSWRFSELVFVCANGLTKCHVA